MIFHSYVSLPEGTSITWNPPESGMPTFTIAKLTQLLLGELGWLGDIPSGKHAENDGKKHNFIIRKSTIPMAMFNIYVSLPEGNWI